jgi:hypothetical protein
MIEIPLKFYTIFNAIEFSVTLEKQHESIHTTRRFYHKQIAHPPAGQFRRAPRRAAITAPAR